MELMDGETINGGNGEDHLFDVEEMILLTAKMVRMF
jgi:hypothetical protein